MATYVLVHGGWVGGWVWQRVAPLLRQAGHEVFTPTLTGVGERAHLASPEVDLQTHTQDIVGVLEYEGLREVVLVGNSSGGVVISAVAEQAAARLAQLIYLDAFVPQHGQALADLLPPQLIAGLEQLAQAHGGGWQVPLPFPPEALGLTSAADRHWVLSRATPYPLKPLFQPVHLSSSAAALLPRTFIACTAPAMGMFERFAERARAEGWRCRELAAGHVPQVTAPRALARLLLELV